MKRSFAQNGNILNKSFYHELLYLIGLVEIRKGGKKFIQRRRECDRQDGALIENAIARVECLNRISQLKNLEEFGETVTEQLFNVALRLSIDWINRILFLKILETQLIQYHRGDRDFAFLNLEKIHNYAELDNLCFEILPREPHDRNSHLRENFAKVPYLNSALFEPTEIEQQTIFLGDLKEQSLSIFAGTVLRDNRGKRRAGQLSGLAYLFEFFDAYDFGFYTLKDSLKDGKKLINEAVLGLIFEKINGYKEGSFYTPSFITSYMCRETIRRSLVQKFNKIKGWHCEKMEQLYEKIENKNEANTIINSLKICDPAVGSGHFLVSALNEIIAIKSELKILLDGTGQSLDNYSIEVQNDQLLVYDDEGNLFEYNPNNAEDQRVQETLFYEKKTIINGCLFGVDINPHAVTICRLRLWIELLKNAYYKADGYLEVLPNIDINIKEGNALINRFPINSDLSIALQINEYDLVTYRDAVESYRNTSNREKKSALLQLINGIKKKICTMLSSHDIDQLNGDIAQLENDYLYEKAFEWRFEFPEVLGDRGDFIGFDVVIGNPPYLSIQDLNKMEKTFIDYYRSNFVSAQQGNFDIYILFIERIKSLTNNFSNSAFIVPSKFLTTDYGKLIRQYLLKNKLISDIVDFEHHQVFDTATTYTCILFFNKIPKDFLYFFKAEPATILDRDYTKHTILYTDLLDKAWILAQNNSIELIKKIKNHSIKLKDLPCDISRGSSTGNDKIFILTRKNDGFINGYGEYVEIEEDILIKPIFATNCNRYIFKNNVDIFLIFPYVFKNQSYSLINENLLKHKYSKAYHYLVEKKAILQERKQVKNWYGFSAARNLINHGTSDILIPLLADRGIFTLSPKSCNYTLMAGGGFSLSVQNKLIDNRFLLCLLNSKLLFFILYQESNKFRGNYITCTKQYFEQLPIKLVSSSTQKQFIKLVDKILDLKNSDRRVDTRELENECDRLVYKLYQLTYDEVRIVDPEFELTEQEYTAISLFCRG